MKITLTLAVILLVGGGLLTYHKTKAAADTTDTDTLATPAGPTFNADSAFAFVKAQCDFGPRDMNSTGHEACRKWIVEKFKAYGCKVTEQKADLKGYNGTLLHSTNIMASYKPEATTRLLLCAHWDSRPWADNDPDSTKHRTPILAANDAASGVAVMLEIARLLQKDSTLNIGVDFVCFDAEDWGTPQWASVPDSESSWALGAQYFASNLPQGYEARYGILLDMVGGQGAKFYQEGVSKKYAAAYVDRIWQAAQAAGYGSYFPMQDGGFITDDHVPLNEKAGIPTVDIIPYYPDCRQSSFGPTWHTVSDDLDHIDRNTLKAVGQTIVQVLWTEQ